MTEVKDPTRSTLDPRLKSMLDIHEAEHKNFVYCALCSNVISRTEFKISVNGSHDHHCTNPHNIQFHLGCFAQSPGCDISGSPQAADSWFMGYVWQLASCAQCHNHLGWYFSRDHDTFYGLILGRIQEDN